MDYRDQARAMLEAALAKLSPSIRAAFLDAMSRSASSVDVAALIDALDRNDLNAAAELLDLPKPLMYQITEAMRAGYIMAGSSAADGLPLKIRATFGFGGNPRAVAQVQRITGEFITRIVDSQREATRAVIAGLVNDGVPARQAALAIVGRIDAATGLRTGGYLGLDGPRSSQAVRVAAMLRDPKLLTGHYEINEATGVKKWVDGYFLPNGNPRYTTTDRRFDKRVRDAIASGKALSQADADQISRAHMARLLKNRADTIARTEGLNVLRAGERAGFQELVDSGTVADERIIREWLPTKDARTRLDHVAMTGQIRVGMGTPFTFPDGRQAMFGGDASLGALPHDLILCRCGVSYRLKRRGA